MGEEGDTFSLLLLKLTIDLIRNNWYNKVSSYIPN